MPEALLSGKHRASHRALRRWLGSAACLAFVTSAVASDCAPEPQGEGRVTATTDARTLRLDDGRIVRLSGLAPLHGTQETQAAATLAALVTGRNVTLHGDSDAPDRYGRQRAWLFVENDDRPLQARLVAAGAGLRDISPVPNGCRESLESAETAARTARLGLWAAARTPKNAESPDDISSEIGHFSVIEGRVRSVRTSGGATYLNFGRRGTDGFAVMVPGRAVAGIEAAGGSLQALAGRTIRVRGYVMRRGGPRLEVTGPDQIDVVDGGAVATAGTRD